MGQKLNMTHKTYLFILTMLFIFKSLFSAVLLLLAEKQTIVALAVWDVIADMFVPKLIFF